MVDSLTRLHPLTQCQQRPVPLGNHLNRILLFRRSLRQQVESSLRASPGPQHLCEFQARSEVTGEDAQCFSQFLLLCCDISKRLVNVGQEVMRFGGLALEM